MTKEMEQQFNRIAKEYDQNRKKFIPCFDDFYESTTSFVAANIAPPKRILDLGAGTGLLSVFWYRHFPESEYVLVDIADEMLAVAKKRFEGVPGVSCEILDYTECLPDGAFDVIVSALSIHHLEQEQKEELFSRIYDKLPAGGLFVNYDQFCAGPDRLNEWFDSCWEKKLQDGELTEADLELWRERRKLDRECSVWEEMQMLKDSNFENVSVIYSNQKFSVLVAGKDS